MPGLTTAYQNIHYQVSTPLFEGPLDLLLHLIERAELDITRLALAEVTDQYLEHLKQLENRPADEVSAFLVIASRLIQIKSEALLPRPPQREPGDEDPGEALARQLLLYRQFKQAAEFLSDRMDRNLRSYLRLAPPPKIEGRLDLSGITLDDLIFAAYGVFETRPVPQRLGTVVAPPKVTIREKIGYILSKVRQEGTFTFRSFFPRKVGRLEVVVTFLAMLELVKRHILQAQQIETFGEIDLHLSPELNENKEIPDDFELEFGE